MCCGCERSDGLKTMGLVDDYGSPNPQNIVRDEEVVKHDKERSWGDSRIKFSPRGNSTQVVVQYIRYRSIPLALWAQRDDKGNYWRQPGFRCP